MGDRWPQRASFKKHLAAYRARTGETIAQVAARLGVTEATVYNWRTRPAVEPSEKSKRALADLFGCSITEFVDDPSTTADITGRQGIDPETRFFSKLIITDLADEALTPADRKALYDAWR